MVVVVVEKIARGSIADPKNIWIIIIPLYLLAGSWGSETKPSSVLATRLNRLPTLTFSRSSGLKNMLPQILYLSQGNTGQSHTKCTLSSLSYTHSRHSCRSVCPSLYRGVLRLVWPVNSPTAALSLNLLTARSSLALPGREYLFSVLDR